MKFVEMGFTSCFTIPGWFCCRGDFNYEVAVIGHRKKNGKAQGQKAADQTVTSPRAQVAKAPAPERKKKVEPLEEPLLPEKTEQPPAKVRQPKKQRKADGVKPKVKSTSKA